MLFEGNKISILMAAAIALEIIWRLNFRKDRVEFRRTLTHLGCGFLVWLLSKVFASSFPFHYILLQSSQDTWDWRMRSPWTWVVCLLSVDLLFYLWHRASHSLGLLWSLHQVHHQGKTMELSLALRQPTLGFFTAGLLILPLAWLGIPWEVTLACVTFHSLWDFALHSHLPIRLPVLSGLVLDPAHHHLHHSDDIDLQKSNFGVIFTLWDRLGGTYRKPEGSHTPAAYGLRHESEPGDPISANLKPVLIIAHESTRRMKMKTRRFKMIEKTTLSALLLLTGLGLDALPAKAGTYTFSSGATALAANTFTTISSIRTDVGSDDIGTIEWLTITGTSANGAAQTATLKVAIGTPTNASIATMASARNAALRNCEKKALLFKSGLSEADAFVVRSYGSLTPCTSDCFSYNTSGIKVISCSLE